MTSAVCRIFLGQRLADTAVPPLTPSVKTNVSIWIRVTQNTKLGTEVANLQTKSLTSCWWLNLIQEAVIYFHTALLSSQDFCLVLGNTVSIPWQMAVIVCGLRTEGVSWLSVTETLFLRFTLLVMSFLMSIPPKIWSQSGKKANLGTQTTPKAVRMHTHLSKEPCLWQSTRLKWFLLEHSAPNSGAQNL